MAGKKQTATMELAIGATIIAAVIILIVMLMAWGNSTSFLSRHYLVVVNMTNVGGLKEGAPVKLGGLQIGKVASIKIRPGATDLEIILNIDEKQLLPKDSTAKVSTAGLVGDAFMEVIPGHSADTIRRASTVAEAERLESSPLPDMSEILVKFNTLGDQLIILMNNVNDIAGDVQFRKSVKSLAVNMDAVTYQANLILQRSQSVIDNIETASQNVATLSTTLKDSVEKVTDDIERITETALGVADDAKSTIENLNSTITDIRSGVNRTINDAEFTAHLKNIAKNSDEISTRIAGRLNSVDEMVDNLNSISADLKVVTAKVREITTPIQSAAVADAVNAMSGAITSLGEVVERIKAEPVLALSVNKAADRIVKSKFDEMSRQPHLKSADAQLQEINRWVRESMRRGYMEDPGFDYHERPYVLDR